MDFIVPFRRLQGLGVVGNRMPPIQGVWLFKDRACREITVISDQLEGFVMIWECKDRSSDKSLD